MKRRKRDGRGKPKRVELPAEAYDRVPRAQLTFTQETVWLTRFDPRGHATTTYPVALEGVAGCFKEFGADTGLLSPETLFWQTRRGAIRIGMWLPPGKRTLLFASGVTSKARSREVRLRVPLPGFVFVGEGTRYWIYAAKGRPTRGVTSSAGSDRLYHAPLPNVYDNGAICQGNVRFPKCAASSMREAVAAFFESQFNSDLARDVVRGNQRWSLLQFLRGLQRRATFPLDRLTPSLTMQQVLGAETGEETE